MHFKILAVAISSRGLDFRLLDSWFHSGNELSPSVLRTWSAAPEIRRGGELPLLTAEAMNQRELDRSVSHSHRQTIHSENVPGLPILFRCAAASKPRKETTQQQKDVFVTGT